MGKASNGERLTGARELPPVAHYRVQSQSAIEYALDETSLPQTGEIEILHSSKGLGWTDVAAAITQESPHVAEHRQISSIWIAMALTPPVIQRKAAGRTLSGTLEPHAIGMTPPGEIVVDTISNHPRTFHFFLKDRVIEEVAEDIYDLGKVSFRTRAAFGATDTTLSHLMHATKQMLLEGGEGDWRSEYIARAVASHILRRHCVLGRKAPAHAGARLSASQIRKADEFIRDSLARPFTFGELAASIGLSRTLFFQRFTHTLQQTPHQYRQRVRIAQAKALIKQGNMTLAEIASACGFSDQTHMIRTFRQLLGTTPGQYRRGIE